MHTPSFMLVSIVTISMVVSALGDQADDETCLLQRSVDATRRSTLSTDSAPGPANLDRIECESWSSNHLSGDMPASCVSAVLRESVLSPDSAFTRESAGRNKFAEATLQPGWCQDIKHCKIANYGPDEFAQLRTQNMPGTSTPAADSLKASFEAGPLTGLTSKSGGKSDATFLKTADGRFIVKAGLTATNKMNEVQNLYDMVLGSNGNKPLFEHLGDHPGSLLNRIYGLVRLELGDSFRTSSDTSIYVILEDATYVQDVPLQKLAQKDIIKYTTLDLKERPGHNAEKFKTSEGGIMKTPKAKCQMLRTNLEYDTEFLGSYNMIDYSLFVGVATSDSATHRVHKTSTVPNCPYSLAVPMCMSGSDDEVGRVQYTVSIIDYLNDLNWFKRGEQRLPGDKWMKFEDWGPKTLALAAEICPYQAGGNYVEDWAPKIE